MRFARFCTKTTYMIVCMNDSLKSYPILRLLKEEYAI